MRFVVWRQSFAPQAIFLRFFARRSRTRFHFKKVGFLDQTPNKFSSSHLSYDMYKSSAKAAAIEPALRTL
jgi:hypothetical protein